VALFKSRNATARVDDFEAVPEIEVQQENIGRTLRRAREENGLDLQQVSQVLRIRYFYLDAIEKGNFDRLPGPAYAAGFIRTYADFLGLDPDSVIQGYRREQDRPKVEGNLTFPTPEQETRIPGAALLLIGLLTAALAYGGWYYLRERPNGVLDLVPELPDRLASLVGGTEQDAAVPEDGAVLELPSSPEADVPPAAPQPQDVPEVSDLATSDPTPAAPEDAEQEALASLEAPAEPAEADESPPAEADEGLADPEGMDETPDGDLAVDAPDPEAAPVLGPDAAGETAPSLAPEPSVLSEPGETRISALSESVDAQEPEPDLGSAVGLPGPQSSPIDDLTSVLEDLPSPPPAPPTAADGGGAAANEAYSDSGRVIAAVDTSVPVPSPEETDETSAGAAIFGQENVDARVVLQATQDSWVQVRDGDGELLLTRVLRPGDIYRTPDREGLTLLTGNAGGLEIFVDGLKLPTLGPVGAVRRNISLDPGNLLADRSGVE
jgi:cytoskeletal protein RodZ